MAGTFTDAEWKKIHTFMDENGGEYGLPKKSTKSVVIGSFNIRKLGSLKNSKGKASRSKGAWEFLAKTAGRFDLLGVQEILDSVDGLNHLKELMGKDFGMVVSDTTGKKPGGAGMAERLGFLFNWKRVTRTEVASDISYDRSEIAGNLFENRDEFWKSFDEYATKLSKWEAKCIERKAARKRRPAKPTMKFPQFLTFIRQPHCASFEIGKKNPYRILAVNAHLLYGKYPKERRMEFFAIIDWLINRAKMAKKMYHPNILFMGDCNLEFKNPEVERPKIDSFIKSLNKKELRSRNAAKINFPFLDPHPIHGLFKTNARLTETFDQMCIIANDKRLPGYKKNSTVKDTGDDYNYGMFNFVNLFSNALYGIDFLDIQKKSDRKKFISKFEHDVSDHMPIWIRIPIPK